MSEFRTLRFNERGLDLVIAALASLPYREVATLIADMQAQLQAQAKPDAELVKEISSAL